MLKLQRILDNAHKMNPFHECCALYGFSYFTGISSLQHQGIFTQIHYDSDIVGKKSLSSESPTGRMSCLL